MHLPRLKTALFSVLLGAALAACGASAASELANDIGAGAGGGTSGSAVASTGSSGGAGGNLDWTPDAGRGGGPDDGLSGLCGGGTPCTPGAMGEDVACQGGNPGTGGGGGGPDLACQLVPNGEGGVQPICAAAGAGLAGDPCTSASNCGPGLGCVAAQGNIGAGQCRAYCCGNPESCGEGTYCAAVNMAEIQEPATPIPACIPATNCDLLGDESQCPTGTTCAVVKDDGTTSCVEPGVGKDCEACPCAAGYVCSAAQNQCKKLCHTDGQHGDECNGGYCQGGFANLPSGIGICADGDGC